jgi:hypothetical protein
MFILRYFEFLVYFIPWKAVFREICMYGLEGDIEHRPYNME